MKVKCENIVRCANYGCGYNQQGTCDKRIIALDESGKCVFERPRRSKTPVKENDTPMDSTSSKLRTEN